MKTSKWNFLNGKRSCEVFLNRENKFPNILYILLNAKINSAFFFRMRKFLIKSSQNIFEKLLQFEIISFNIFLLRLNKEVVSD